MRLRIASLRRAVKGDLRIEFVQQDLTSFGGLELLRRYFQLLDLHRRIRQAFSAYGLGGGAVVEELRLIQAGMRVGQDRVGTRPFPGWKWRSPGSPGAQSSLDPPSCCCIFLDESLEAGALIAPCETESVGIVLECVVPANAPNRSRGCRIPKRAVRDPRQSQPIDQGKHPCLLRSAAFRERMRR